MMNGSLRHGHRLRPAQALRLAITATAVSAAAGFLAAPALASSGTPAGKPATGRISGRVTGAGHPLHDICVNATEKYTYQFYHTNTAKNGQYSVAGLQPGRYYVTFADCSNQGSWLSQWYKSANSPHNPPNQPPAGAVLLRIRAGMALTGINGKLKAGASISGTVTDATTGKGIAGACAEATADNLDQFGFAFHLTKSGSYTIRALFPGAYLLRFGCGKGNYAPQWWQESPTTAQATLIHITGPQNLKNINARLGPGGVITGTVYGANSSGPPIPLASVCVYAASTKPKGNGSDGNSGSDGSYSVSSLATGTYTLTFDPLCGGGDGYSQNTVKNVQVTAGSTTSGISVVLPVCTKNCMARSGVRADPQVRRS